MIEDLLIKPGSNLFTRLTSISWNIQDDKLTPSIWVAQETILKEILTDKLFDKILIDFKANTLTGEYLTLYNDYAVLMLVFFSASDFVSKNGIVNGNAGNFKNQPMNTQIVDSKETDRQVKYYRELGESFHMKFIEYMKDKNIPEYTKGNSNDSNFSLGMYFNTNNGR